MLKSIGTGYEDAVKRVVKRREEHRKEAPTCIGTEYEDVVKEREEHREDVLGS